MCQSDRKWLKVNKVLTQRKMQKFLKKQCIKILAKDQKCQTNLVINVSNYKALKVINLYWHNAKYLKTKSYKPKPTNLNLRWFRIARHSIRVIYHSNGLLIWSTKQHHQVKLLRGEKLTLNCISQSKWLLFWFLSAWTMPFAIHFCTWFENLS